jgi:hypothetical protein
MRLALVRGAFKWDQPGVQAPQIQHVSDLPRQRKALLTDPALREHAQCIINCARQTIQQLYERVGLELGEDQLLVEFLQQSKSPSGLELLQNKGVSGHTYRGANGFLSTYIPIEFRSYRVEPTYNFQGVTAVRAFLVVGGISEDEILKQQSKRRANSMHDRQIELWLLYMESKCVRIICWQGDTGTTSSGLTYECMAKVGVLLGGTVPPGYFIWCPQFSGRSLPYHCGRVVPG